MTRFLFLADPQLGCYASFSGMTEAEIARFAQRGLKVRPAPKTDGLEWDAARYSLAIAEANRLRPDFVVIGGDMVDDVWSESQLAAFFRITAQLDPSIPIRYVPGNHDAATDGIAPTKESIARYRSLFGEDYYAFDHPGDDGPRFIVMNTSVAARSESVAREWEEQLAFLRETLAETAASGRRVVLFGHHPLFVDSAAEADTYWNIPGERRAAILELLRAQRTDVVVFAGHLHRNASASDGAIEVVASGPVGYPLGDDPSGYRVVEVTAGGVKHEYRPLPEEVSEQTPTG